MYLLYIDPGTGSMLFSVLIGLAAASYFLFRTLIIRFKSIFIKKGSLPSKHNDFVIYNEGNQYWPVFCPILEEFEKRNTKVLYLTSSINDPVFQKDYIHIHPEFIGTGNKAFSVLNFLEADICLMTTPGLEVYQLKRSKSCRHYSHILHDTGDVTCYRMFGVDWFDSILLSGEYQINDIRKLENLRSLSQKQLIVTGSTYLDYYKNKISDLSNTEKKPFTVLVSPSWGTGALLNVMGEKLLNALNDCRWNIIIRPHPQSKISEAEMLKKLEEKYSFYTWDYNSENISSLFNADIMISDFSSVVFDYIFLFDRPVLYHNASFNKDIYDAGDIESEPWKFQAIKRFGTEISEHELPNIKEIIQNAVKDTSLSAQRSLERNTAWQNIGYSGKAVVDALTEIRENYNL